MTQKGNKVVDWKQSARNKNPGGGADNMRIVQRGVDMDPLLFDLLSYKTPYGLEGITASQILAFLKTTPYIGSMAISIDPMGNLIIKSKGKDNILTPKVMFSSHMDTVHRIIDDEKNINVDNLQAMKDLYRQYLYTPTRAWGEPNLDYVWAADHTISEKSGKGIRKACTLGADDKVGCWIMCKLLESGQEGLYVFHVGEECGRLGSKYLAENTPAVVKDVDMCIAFDRAGYADIIDRQSCGPCASTAFVDTFAVELLRASVHANVSRLHGAAKWQRDTGSFTDSASYVHLIQECTNLSVGYFNQHGPTEHFDHFWVKEYLMPTLLNVDWSKLAVERTKSAVNPNITKRYDYSANNIPELLGASSKHWSEVPAKNLKKLHMDVIMGCIPDWELSDGISTDFETGVWQTLIMNWMRDFPNRDDRSAELVEYIEDAQAAKAQMLKLEKMASINVDVCNVLLTLVKEKLGDVDVDELLKGHRDAMEELLYEEDTSEEVQPEDDEVVDTDQFEEEDMFDCMIAILDSLTMSMVYQHIDVELPENQKEAMNTIDQISRYQDGLASIIEDFLLAVMETGMDMTDQHNVWWWIDIRDGICSDIPELTEEDAGYKLCQVLKELE